MPLLNFTGSDKIFARAWFQKLQIYFSHHPMDEEEGIKITSMFLDGIAYEWWHNDITMLGCRKVKNFERFSKMVLDRFEHKHIEEYFKELDML